MRESIHVLYWNYNSPFEGSCEDSINLVLDHLYFSPKSEIIEKFSRRHWCDFVCSLWVSFWAADNCSKMENHEPPLIPADFCITLHHLLHHTKILLPYVYWMNLMKSRGALLVPLSAKGLSNYLKYREHKEDKLVLPAGKKEYGKSKQQTTSHTMHRYNRRRTWNREMGKRGPGGSWKFWCLHMCRRSVTTNPCWAIRIVKGLLPPVVRRTAAMALTDRALTLCQPLEW